MSSFPKATRARRQLLLICRVGIVEHCPEGGVTDLGLLFPEFLLSLRLRQTNSSDLGVRKDKGGDVLVVHLRRCEVLPFFGMFGAKEPISQSASSHDGHGVQLCLPSNIAQSVDALHGGILVFVDF